MTIQALREGQVRQMEVLDRVEAYQRDTNGKVGVAFERLAVLEERTQSFKDRGARVTSLISTGIAIVGLIITLAALSHK
jgi:hypothetical protein